MTDDTTKPPSSSTLPAALEGREPISFKGERVLTTGLAARTFSTDEKVIRQNFDRNAVRFEAGKHYHLVTGADLRRLKDCTSFRGVVDKRAPSLYLWTERGIARHAKILETETAWAIFEALEDTYFRVRAAVALPAAAPTPQDAREARLLHKHYLSIGRMAGLDGQQCLIAANRAVKAQLGVDPLGIMGITHMIAPTNDLLVTPTALGLKLGGISARRVNAMFAAGGYQTEERDGSGRLEWRPTEAGKKIGGRMVDVERNNNTGAAMPLKWPLTVVEILREMTKAPA